MESAQTTQPQRKPFEPTRPTGKVVAYGHFEIPEEVKKALREAGPNAKVTVTWPK